MSTFHAFGNAATKQALQADVRSKGPVYCVWLTHASIEGDLTMISQDYGLHPALVRLLPALGAFGEDDAALTFYDALLERIPVGAGTGHLARRTVLLAWTDPVHGRARHVEAGAVRDACVAIITLVQRSLDTTVDKPSWRAARTRLTQAQREAPASEPVVDLMLSLAWDLELSPGAVQDVMRAWTAQLSAEAEASDEDPFTEAEASFFKSAMDRISEESFTALNMVDGDGDPSYEEFLEEVNKRWAADPVTLALKERSVARQARIKARLALWRSEMQQKMLDDAATLVV
ncbi:hypothetical protein [Janthinobacterium sp. PC23-8]|uniref:hypothetical protein n=1 Tax=Janthinobacterium sp. PC23-8 TaxID=2012679 RepID=UPI000B96F15A|nr:hypothetical protein [Janthinobacterium sp. PC23-8]OYO30723.1 hypothetical protein CD932_05955 [Janthinobacterium sp. PC23-8]